MNTYRLAHISKCGAYATRQDEEMPAQLIAGYLDEIASAERFAVDEMRQRHGATE